MSSLNTSGIVFNNGEYELDDDLIRKNVKIKMSDTTRKRKRKEYASRPHVVKKRKEYLSRPDVKESRKMYQQLPEVKERNKLNSKKRREYISFLKTLTDCREMRELYDLVKENSQKEETTPEDIDQSVNMVKDLAVKIKEELIDKVPRLVFNRI